MIYPVICNNNISSGFNRVFGSITRYSKNCAYSYSLSHDVRSVILLIHGLECRSYNGQSVCVQHFVRVIIDFNVFISVILLSFFRHRSRVKYLGDNEVGRCLANE